MILCAPVNGKLIAIKDVPDPVFSEKMLGDGFAVESNEEKKDFIYAPVSGVIKNINANGHAFIIETEEGVDVLTHVGVETVALKGKGFKVLAKVGRKVGLGDKILKVDFDFVRKNAPASMVIVVLANRPDAIVSLGTSGDVKRGDVVFNLTESTSESCGCNCGGDAQTQMIEGDWIVIPNPHGLHARPSATLAKKAMAFSASVSLEQEGGKTVGAKSSTGIMSLGLPHGARVRFISSDAQAIKDLNQAVLDGLGEDVGASSVPSPAASSAKSAGQTEKAPAPSPLFKLDFSGESRLALPVSSPGINMGEIYVLKEAERNISANGAGVDVEKKSLKKALEQALKDLDAEMKGVDNESAEILEAHKAFLMDPELETLSMKVIESGKSASFAWNSVTREQAEIFAQSGNAYMAERAADMRDINNRILDLLLGKVPAPEYPESCVVVIYELTPSDVTGFDKRIKGVISVVGSPTSHASIMLRNRGIPSFFKAPDELMMAPAGVVAILDTDSGTCIINANSQERTDYQHKILEMEQRKALALSAAGKRGETKDGYRIEVTGNVSSIKEAKEATERGGEGYGLARSEFLFYGKKTAPTEDEQRDLYQGLLDATTHMVTVRLLDAGGDKPLAYVKIPKENNPQLGIRGMRIIEDNEEIYRTQIRALLRCKDLDRLRIMTPMISLVSEVHLMSKIIAEEKQKLGIRQSPQVGIMAETPAVCVLSEQFAPHVDFFSVGTNDLTQYTMAMDRENSRLAPLASAANPAVLTMIHHLCVGAQKFSKPVAVCGAAASDPVTALLFVGLGVTELASAAETLPEVKAAIRNYTMKQLKEVSLRALRASTEDEVRKIVKRELNI
ncbi:MAG: phosphoenolpyruvate--protein phosphotransferase [Spirochaetia bacterium]